ncbi:MAG: Peroxisomal membrane protein pex16 [Cirrosporium novae-zelandiae]|nr:MAG: Peroxisomal membrane protein pex16 [Cirrosporium novae-zelandiae]
MRDLNHKGKSKLPQVLSLPSKCVNMYAEFIYKNASSVAQIESGLRSLTYIIPDDRIVSDNTYPAIVHTTIQLISLYHTSLLTRSFTQTQPASVPGSTPPPPPSPHTRYTSYWTSHSPLYKRVAIFLQTIQYTELLCEMAAKRRSEKTRWHVVVMLEGLKAICRIILLRVTKSRPLVTPALPERPFIPEEEPDQVLPDEMYPWKHQEGEKDKKEKEKERKHHPSSLPSPPPSPHPSLSKSSSSSSSHGPSTWHMPRTGLSLPELPSPNDITSYLLSRVLTADDIKPPMQLLHRLSSSQGQFAEILSILRPLIYAILLSRFSSLVKGMRSGSSGKGRGSSSSSSLEMWIPWLVGIGLEIGSRRLAERDLREKVAGGWRGMTGLEREELGKRGWGIGWWALRGGFYQAITRPCLTSITNRLKGKPLLDLVGNVLEDYDGLWDQYYFSTASM